MIHIPYALVRLVQAVTQQPSQIPFLEMAMAVTRMVQPVKKVKVNIYFNKWEKSIFIDQKLRQNIEHTQF